MGSIATGTVVERGGVRGVVVADAYNVCADWETPVVWYGSEGYEGTPTEQLVEVGPDPAVADLAKCGGGTDCCVFLTMGPGGFQCARFTELREMILMRSYRGEMTAKRRPVLAFPDCQSERSEMSEIKEAAEPVVAGDPIAIAIATVGKRVELAALEVSLQAAARGERRPNLVRSAFITGLEFGLALAAADASVGATTLRWLGAKLDAFGDTELAAAEVAEFVKTVAAA